MADYFPIYQGFGIFTWYVVTSSAMGLCAIFLERRFGGKCLPFSIKLEHWHVGSVSAKYLFLHAIADRESLLDHHMKPAIYFSKETGHGAANYLTS